MTISMASTMRNNVEMQVLGSDSMVIKFDILSEIKVVVGFFLD